MVVTTTVKFSRITFLTKFPIKYKKKKKFEIMFNQFFFHIDINVQALD